MPLEHRYVIAHNRARAVQDQLLYVSLRVIYVPNREIMCRFGDQS